MEVMENEFPFNHFADIQRTVAKRPACVRCRRPKRVCICSYFPACPFSISTHVYILQHPREQDFRLLTTVPLLQECLPKDKCTVYRGKRFPKSKFPALHEVFHQENAVLLFPSKEAVHIEEFVESNDSLIHLIVLDGTWREAKSIYFNCPVLHSLKKVMLSGVWRSQFVIRTQPNNDSVSTLEAVAIAVAQLESKPELIEVARKPLKALCRIQLEHGASVHQSKEELSKMGIKYRCFESYKKDAK